ncbi:MAG: hypothetical protein ACOX7E_04410 [Paludibacter sp.]
MLGVSSFNESDFGANNASDAVTIINTHQLEGSFENFRDVYARAEQAGKKSAGS